MKRFYRIVASGAAEAGFGVTLDGRPLKTPAGRTLSVPTPGLAAALAAEWDAQGEAVVAASMPLMQLVSTALDRMPLTREQVAGFLAGFAASDLLCYRAESPADLARLQAERWQPWLDWADRHLGAALSVTGGVVPVTQDRAALAALRRKVEDCDDWTLTALQSLTPCLGSLVLALAVAEGELAAEEAFGLSRLDEEFQAGRWGVDSEAEARAAGLRREVAAAARLLDLIRAG